MSAPRVSVVTPAYNSADFIAETVGSVLAQTFTDFEMLVVDDCSSDDTCQVVAAIAERDPRVRLLRNEVNGGPAEARNTALAAARGRYVAFLDSDDLWVETKLAEQLRFMEACGAPITYTSFRRIDEQGVPLTREIRIPERVDYGALLKNTAIATSTAMVDLQQTGAIRMKRTYYDDLALWLDLLRRGFAARGLRADLMRYRVRRGSWSRNKLHSAGKVWQTYREVEKLRMDQAIWCFAHYACNAVVKYYQN